MPMFSELSVSSLRELKSSVCSYQSKVGSRQLAASSRKESKSTVGGEEARDNIEESRF